MLPTSLRWRLPITYAVIALLTVIALGVVLVTTLRAYYSEREWEYLNGNARAIAEGISAMLRYDAPLEIVQAQLENFSFLSQARIRLLDVERQLVAESADPREILISMIYTRAPALPPGSEEGSGVIVWESAIDAAASTLGSPATPAPLGSESDVPTAQQIVPLMSVEGNRDYFIQRRIEADEAHPREFFYRMAVAGTPFGFGLNRETAITGPRSDQQVSISLLSPDDALLGYVELSEGPAYGTEIMTGVLHALVAAGAVAVVVAGGTGWYISRRITAPLIVLTDATTLMARGQLSARVQVAGEDEFGLLGRSFNQMA
ncbi:MAG: HAMP domain-containing protein, partial [Acidobacteriales bacterium]|nr:HAMP domain-containing protein [Terriglobales bacterium]